MQVLQVELPDKMAAELDALVKMGWFTDEGEIVRLALLEFIRHEAEVALQRVSHSSLWLSARVRAEAKPALDLMLPPTFHE